MSAAAGRRYPWNRVRPEGFRLTSALQSGQFLTRGDPQGARDGTRQFVYATVIPLAALLLGLATVGCGETPPEVVVVEEPGSGLLALLHESSLARTMPNRQDPHLPMRYDAGRPRAVIRFRISQPRTASLPCPAGLRARRPAPMMDL